MILSATLRVTHSCVLATSKTHFNIYGNVFYCSTSHQQVSKFIAGNEVIVDVRSPKEYLHGHIPRAVNIPLFTDEERHIIGKTYKESGKPKAVEQGLKIVGPKLYDYVKQAKEQIKKQGATGPIHVYCARGGMRSNSMSWLFNTSCLSAITLPGGYKAFRQWVLHTLSLPRSFIVLGGMTGAGKTRILQELANQGEQVVDLEHIANHKGSAFGWINMHPQPTQEAFENELAVVLSRFDVSRPVWLEDESSHIGTISLPLGFKPQMLSKSTPVIFVERPDSERMVILQDEYGTAEISKLVEATKRLEKRLGAERANAVVKLIEQGDITTAIKEVLKYYDKTYQYSKQRHSDQFQKSVNAVGLDASQWATLLRKEALSLPSLLLEEKEKETETKTETETEKEKEKEKEIEINNEKEATKKITNTPEYVGGDIKLAFTYLLCY